MVWYEIPSYCSVVQCHIMTIVSMSADCTGGMKTMVTMYFIVYILSFCIFKDTDITLSLKCILLSMHHIIMESHVTCHVTQYKTSPQDLMWDFRDHDN